MEESEISIKRIIQWHIGHQFFVELAVKPKIDSFVTSFDDFLNGLKAMLLQAPEKIECAMLAEMTRQNLNILYSFYTETPQKRPAIDGAKKTAWKNTVTEIKGLVKGIQNTPTNILFQETEMLERGLGIIKANDDDGVFKMFGKFIQGGVELFSTGNPTKLLAGLKECAQAAASKIINDKLAQVFIMTFHMEKIRRWYFLESLRLNEKVFTIKADQEKSEKESHFKKGARKYLLGEDLRGLVSTNDKNTMVESLKQTLCKFEKEVLVYSNSSYVGYCWVKMLGEMITTDRVIMPRSDLEKEIVSCCGQRDTAAVIKGIVEINWASYVHQDYLMLNTTLAGLPRGLPVPLAIKLKKSLLNNRFSDCLSTIMQEF